MDYIVKKYQLDKPVLAEIYSCVPRFQNHPRVRTKLTC